ncbi:Helix-turn-helix transcriptional regulator [Tenacibaculum sp. 190130A14a]|uniref:Helix-turn-helix transcriptional regulator n=1 Tax=Tenacibaculum polynesiense TaxID=3137857 RepID=A0ABP1F1Y2_9FLAO
MKKKVDDFFSLKNSIQRLTEKDFENDFDYLASIEAFARTTYKSIIVVDYDKKGFEYVSENPLFLCGDSPEDVKKMGYAYYFKNVAEEDIDLLFKINTVGFDFYEQIPLEDRLQYTISYDFHIVNQESRRVLVNQKLTPMFLTEEGKIWKAICIKSLSSKETSGNIQIFKENENKMFCYNLEGDYWETKEKIQLTSREREILIYSSRGFTINEIAEAIFVSPDTVKFHRKKIFEKLETANITEAISFATNNKLI